MHASATKEPQIASRVILVRPTGFAHDPQTAASNGFQRGVEGVDVRRAAEREFDELLEHLRGCGIGIAVLDPVDPTAPNGVFPNNWFSTHPDGTVVLYPMHTVSRRVERDTDIALSLRREGIQVNGVMDMGRTEEQGQFLEGTGSLVLDRVNKVAFACLSPRTTEHALAAWCDRMGYRALPFTATMDGTLAGAPVYHTNVVMSIGEDVVVACLDAIPYPAERQDVEEELMRSRREIVRITVAQMHQYLGNILQLRGRPLDPKEGEDRFILMSGKAFLALEPWQRIILQRHGQLVPVNVPTIEAVGGGSIRCMLAENFLPLRHP
jgi:hypothetical protein